VRFAAEQGLTNVSIDLMIGLPGQSTRSFSENVKTALLLPISHLSIYMLELHTATPLHEQVARGGIQLPPEEMVTDAYASLVARLARAGLKQYELSNFARTAFESRHNMKYWRRQPVIGFGLSAASFDGVLRWKNTRSLGNYMQRVEAGLSLREEEIHIGEEESMRERLFLGLRLREGVPQEWLQTFCLGRERLKQRWNLFRRHGWVELSGGHWRLTTSGFLVSNEILSELV
jgi:coproporphyrinogen III oxidase-like Fe-S oxidoreductase